MTSIELLAPAGDLMRLKTAVNFGANAVYIGGKKFSLRSRASNFDLDDIKAGAEYAHAFGAKLFVTINMIPHQEDLEGLKEYIISLDRAGVDAVIVASLYVAKVARVCSERMEVHLSTQLSSTNAQSLRFYRSLGIDRVVLARECSMDDVEEIAKLGIVPIEVFVHGGMCVNVSGRCTLSNYMTTRDANRGGCAQSCRWKYEVFSKDHALLSDESTLFSMSSKDLNAVTVMPRLLTSGVVSLKIEGRMKSEYYIATVVGAYRRLIDDLLAGKDRVESIQKAANEIQRAENRATFSGFYESMPSEEGHLYGANGQPVTQEFVGTVVSYDPSTSLAKVQVRNHFEVGHTLEVFGPKLDHVRFVLKELVNSEDEQVSRVYKPMEIVTLKIPFEVSENDFIRRIA